MLSLRRGQVGVIFTHHMFCPRCGVALSRAIELCSGCGADLRPLLATGFLNAPVGPAPSGADPRQADAVRWMDIPTAPAVATFSPDAPVLAAGGAAVEGALGIAGAGRAARAVLPLAPEMLDSDVTRLGASELPTGAGMDEESTWTPSSPECASPSQQRQNRRRTDAARLADEGPLEVGQLFGTRYRIIRLLGIGGMGAVYQAWDSELEVALAFKVIRPDAIADPGCGRRDRSALQT